MFDTFSHAGFLWVVVTLDHQPESCFTNRMSTSRSVTRYVLFYKNLKNARDIINEISDEFNIDRRH